MEGFEGKDCAESLKRMITEEFRAINPKHGHQYMEKNAARWLMFSNHEDPLPINEHDRRAEFIENPSEVKSEEYYHGLYAALSTPAFIASVRHRLETTDLTGFNPGSRATMNAQKMKALDASTDEVELAVKQFKKEWPGDFAMNRTIREFIREFTGADVKPAHFKRVLRRAGFTVVKRVFTVDYKNERISIVRNLTAEDVLGFDSDYVVNRAKQWSVDLTHRNSVLTIQGAATYTPVPYKPI